MHDLIIVTIIAAVIIDQLRKRGAIEWLTMNMGRLVSSRRGAELSIAGAVVAVDMLTANNTIAILAVGPVARSISYRYGIDAKHSASILDTMSCFAQGIIPWGAQLLIAAGLASINPLDIIPFLYYPYILGAFTILYILFHKK
jgi:Na+/H+ antiporter NhaC